LIIKALDKTRTYFACEQGLSLNRMFLYAFAFKTRSQLKYEGVFCLCKWFRTAILPITLLPIPLLPYCLLEIAQNAQK